MKKIIVKKRDNLYIKVEESIYCDFCGQSDKMVFTSEFVDESPTSRDNNEMQICFDCVRQLSKLIK